MMELLLGMISPVTRIIITVKATAKQINALFFLVEGSRLNSIQQSNRIYRMISKAKKTANFPAFSQI